MNFIKLLLCTLLISTINTATADTTEIRAVSYKDIRKSISTLSMARPSTTTNIFGAPYASVFCKAEKDSESYYELRYPTKAATKNNIDDSFTNEGQTPAECTPIRFYKKNSYKLGIVLTDATSTAPLNCQYSCQRGRSSNKIQKISIADFEKQIK